MAEREASIEKTIIVRGDHWSWAEIPLEKRPLKNPILPPILPEHAEVQFLIPYDVMHNKRPLTIFGSEIIEC